LFRLAARPATRAVSLTVAITLTLSTLSHSASSPKTETALEKRFQSQVAPFLQSYCLSCHDHSKPKGDFDISPFHNLSTVTRALSHWELIADRIEANEMPPKKADRHPSASERKAVLDWIRAMRQYEGDRNAGDPGPVPPRRLSNAEYDHTIRDLTGHHLRPTREFPVDPANLAGFDNSGESLAMSPALVKKYLAAARSISEHLILHPDGIDFAPHPVVTDTDRDKYGVRRIVDFYKRQPTDYADYFEAAWRFKHRANLGMPKTRLDEVAKRQKISSNYLQTVWSALTEGEETVGPLATLRKQWNSIPAPRSAKSSTNDLHVRFVEMRDFVVQLRSKIVPFVPNLSAPEINPSAQCLVLWKDREWASNRRKYDPSRLQIDGIVPPEPETKRQGRQKPAKKQLPDPHLAVPSDPAQRARYESAFARFAAIFPDAFFISERARSFLDPEEEKANGNAGRLLSAGLHSMTGYFRDDGPLYDLVLDDAGQQELDRLWREFDFVASVPHRMHKSTIWFERTDSRFMLDVEFDFARAEDKDCVSEEKVKKLGEVYYQKAKRTGANPIALTAIQDHFRRVWEDIDRVDRSRVTAEPKHLVALQHFAERAYRRPLTSAERDGLTAFYHTVRSREGLDHEEAIRDSVAGILMSPHFLYRVDLSDSRAEISPLSNYSLASRLSYFLWSSMPDSELLTQAAAARLSQPKVLIAQTRRMLQDPRARALGSEFLASWLEIRRFDEWNSVDRERFPQFDNDLREAMFEEPVRFLTDMAQNNRSILDLIHANHTFVNASLARHYGIPRTFSGSNDWIRVDNASTYDRGGLLPMSVFLTKNSPGLRTSPVKRGFWVVHRVLGRTIPPPPPNVPDLPTDESKLGLLTLREVLAKHRDNAACSGCHARFDAYGLVFEGFGPIGERRTQDLSGHPVDTRATFLDGAEAQGVEGLRRYLKRSRDEDFIDTFCRQLFAFALGRTLLPSDDAALRDMKTKLAGNQYRLHTLVETIVTSPQFGSKRESTKPSTITP